MLEPVGAGIIAWVLLGESLNIAQIVGTLIVLLGIVLAETARAAAPPLLDEQEARSQPTQSAVAVPEGLAP
jgi:drug/metabolite transporter (DMT)-like permease